MSKAVHKYSRTLLLGLLIALLLINTLVLAPEVGAASDTNRTETDLTLSDNIPTAEADVLTHRAITMDEAKKEAQAAVSEQLAIFAAVEEDDEDEDVIETQTEDVDVSYESTESTASAGSSTKDDDKTSSAATTAATTATTATSTVTSTTSSDFLMDIDNPDPNYVGRTITLTDYDRDLAERIVMGEAGSIGFTGMALVAQCIRDTYIKGHYTNIADVLYENGYYGSMSITPSQTCKDVISYIFDQGGSAVQHRIQVFYATNYCYSSWHETQNYVCSYDCVRFFDMYY